jgi:flagellar basal-body rod modification protein FlgD
VALTSQAVSNSGVYNTASTTEKTNKNELTMQDFFTLLAAQLQNQDMLDPVDNTQFIAQMAQFSALSATQELSGSFTNFLLVSYIGKNVKAVITDPIGNQTKIEGTAEKVEFINGETYITVDGTRVLPEEIYEVTD